MQNPAKVLPNFYINVCKEERERVCVCVYVCVCVCVNSEWLEWLHYVTFTCVHFDHMNMCYFAPVLSSHLSHCIETLTYPAVTLRFPLFLRWPVRKVWVGIVLRVKVQNLLTVQYMWNALLFLIFLWSNLKPCAMIVYIIIVIIILVCSVWQMWCNICLLTGITCNLWCCDVCRNSSVAFMFAVVVHSLQNTYRINGRMTLNYSVIK